MATKTARQILMSDVKYGGIRPRDQGQMIVRVWYAHEDGPIELITDRGDGGITAIQYRWSARRPFEPQNGLTGAVGRGQRVTLVDDLSERA